MTLKLEYLQVSGSFKYRGASNAIASLPEETTHVIATSGGNHGLAVAIAAKRAGISSTIVVPQTTPTDKADRIRKTGADVVIYGAEFAEAEAYARSLEVADGAFIHPFADHHVIEGQGTVGIEILQQLDNECDGVVVAVGGGGLLAGIAAALETSSLQVFAAEPTGIPTMHAALAAGHPVDVTVNSIAASSLGARRTEQNVLDIVQRSLTDVALVDDEAIMSAQQLLWDECRIAVEIGAATALAAVLDDRIAAQNPCVVLCGANSGWHCD